MAANFPSCFCQVPLIFPFIPPLQHPCALVCSSFSRHCKALYHSPVQLEKPLSPASFNAVFFNFILCFSPDPFIAETPFLFCPFPPPHKPLSVYLTLKPAKAPETAACLWKGMKRDVEGVRCLHLDHTAPLSNQLLHTSGCCIQRCFLTFNSPKWVSFLGIRLLSKLN